MTPERLEKLRHRIREIDSNILELTAERMEICRQVGEYKRDHQLPVKDYKVEKLIIERIRNSAKSLNISPELAESLMKELIKYSVLEQEEIKATHISQSAENTDKKVLIVGGAGNMGRWMAQFFEALGHPVRIYDSRSKSNDLFLTFSDLDEATEWAQIIVLATPMIETNKLLKDFATNKLAATIIEITSLKSPIKEGIDACIQNKVELVSIHPMFGPDVKILSGRNFIICRGSSCSPKTLSTVSAMFRLTSANVVELPLEEHDAYMSYVLGSAHLINLIYAKVLEQSGIAMKDLELLAGTTFSKQLQVTLNVVEENPDLYFDIQSLNLETDKLFLQLSKILTSFKVLVQKQDRTGFKNAMAEALKYFS